MQPALTTAFATSAPSMAARWLPGGQKAYRAMEPWRQLEKTGKARQGPGRPGKDQEGPGRTRPSNPNFVFPLAGGATLGDLNAILDSLGAIMDHHVAI